MKIQLILDLIKDGVFKGDPEKSVNKVQLWKNPSEAHEETLYVAPASSAVPVSFQGQVICVSDMSVMSTVQQIRALLNKDYMRYERLSSLLYQAQEDGSVDEIVQRCRAVFENPVWILGAQFEIIGFSVAATPAVYRGHKTYPPNIISPTQQTQILEKDVACNYRRIVSPIKKNQNVIGYLLVLSQEHNFLDALDIDYADRVSTILSNWSKLDELEKMGWTEENFILDLLHDRKKNSAALLRSIKEINFPTADIYYVLCIERTESEQSLPILQELKIALKQNVYTSGRYYVAILGRERNFPLNLDELEDFGALLRKYKLKAGLSMGTHDITLLGDMYRQAIDSIAIKTPYEEKDMPVVRYEDTLLQHMFKILDKNDINLITLCMPSVLDVLNYDKANNTELFQTLRVYLLNGFSLSVAANILYVHRNTVYKRINTLKEKFSIHFDDRAEILRLIISVSIIEYIGLDT